MSRVILFLFLFFTFCATASSDMCFTNSKENVNFISPSNQFHVTSLKVSILHDLVVQLCIAKGDTTPIFIDFRPVYFHDNYVFTTIAYDTLRFLRQESLSVEGTFSKEFGIMLVIRERDLDFEKILNLLSTALDFPKEVQQNQKNKTINTRSGNEEFKTISNVDILKYQSRKDAKVDSLLKLKTFEFSEIESEERGYNYYFLNNKFHVIQVLKKENSTQVKEELVLDSILGLYSDDCGGGFVFTNHHSFYYFTASKTGFQGPYTIKDSFEFGMPLRGFKCKEKPIKYSTFQMHSQRLIPVLFIPESEIVVANYPELSEAYLEGLVEEKRALFKQKTLILQVLWALGAFSILFFAFILFKKRIISHR